MQRNVRRNDRERPKPSWLQTHIGPILLALIVLAATPYVLGPPAGAAPVTVAAYAPDEPFNVSFSLCGRAPRINCVVDGDTFYLDRQKIRIADIDTPEVAQPACPAENERGQAATARLIVLLNDGAFSVVREGRDEDRYGRKLRVVVRDGRSIGDTLVTEGLAHPWRGRKESWCG